jgi:hypothetical protein
MSEVLTGTRENYRRLQYIDCKVVVRQGVNLW